MATPASPVTRRRLPRPLREFLALEAAGGIVLFAGAALALAWANSPWQGSYERLWGTDLLVRLGHLELEEDLRHWVNSGLMTVFFFVVGLEIKRELVTGELRHRRAAALPAVAALGGMVVPAVIYAALNAGGAGARGWGIPMATDIAFAVGVLALLGPRVPGSLRLFLLTLAIVDDIGAIVVIALFYAGGLELPAIAGAAGLLAAMAGLRKAGVQWLPVYMALGTGVWLCTYLSGVEATIAGVVLGLLAPARPLVPAALAREWASDLEDEPTPSQLAAMTEVARASVSVVERLEHRLHPLSGFVIVPIFALANAGVAIRADSLEGTGTVRVALGVVLGLVVGKTIGIGAFTWLAVRMGIGSLPSDTNGRQLAGVAAVAGVGFTVSLFVGSLALDDADPALEAAAKIGVLAASALAALLGSTILLWASRSDLEPA